MTLDEFIQKYKGQRVEFDGLYQYQCVDLVQFYNKEVVGAPPLSGNAKDYVNNPQPSYYEYKINYLWYIPPRGAIAVWSGAVGDGNGHVAIVLEANLMKLSSLDQNWPIGGPVSIIEHNYTNILGFLVPRPRDVVTIYNTLVDDLRVLANKYPKV